MRLTLPGLGFARKQTRTQVLLVQFTDTQLAISAITVTAAENGASWSVSGVGSDINASNGHWAVEWEAPGVQAGP